MRSIPRPTVCRVRSGHAGEDTAHAQFNGSFDCSVRVMRAVKVLTDPRAGVRLKASSVTVSTVGLVPQIERFCEDATNGAALAISLHAVTDDVRDKVCVWLSRDAPFV